MSAGRPQASHASTAHPATSPGLPYANASNASPTPLVSVVIATYNSGATITETVRSVLIQTVQDFEIIVVDDGSTDGSLELLRRAFDDPRLRLIGQDNAGPAAARNAGIARARGEYVSMLDSDDLWLPHYLAQMTRTLRESPQAGFAYTDAWALDEVSGRIRRDSAMSRLRPDDQSPARGAFLEALVQRNFIFNSVTIRREVLEAIGGYDEGLSQAEDYELWLRACAYGHQGVRAPGRLAVYRVRPDSLSRDVEGALAGLCGAYREVVDHHPAPEAVKEHARERLALMQRLLDQRTSRSMLARVRRGSRRVISDATWPLRSRRMLLREPPDEVSEAFPWIGQARS